MCHSRAKTISFVYQKFIDSPPPLWYYLARVGNGVLLVALDPWCSGLTCGPVKAEIAGSNPVGSANFKGKTCFQGWFTNISDPTKRLLSELFKGVVLRLIQ